MRTLRYGFAILPFGLTVAAQIPIRVLSKCPTDTETELQIICLFKSDPANQLHGSLIEMNEKLKGLLDRIRKPSLFRGELGETLLTLPVQEPSRRKGFSSSDSEILRISHRNGWNWLDRLLTVRQAVPVWPIHSLLRPC